MTDDTNNIEDQPIDNAVLVIKRFGGIRPMATKMDIPVTTVQGWKKRNTIPANRRDDVLVAAAKHGVDLDGLIRQDDSDDSIVSVSETKVPTEEKKKPKNTNAAKDQSFADTVRTSAPVPPEDIDIDTKSSEHTYASLPDHERDAITAQIKEAQAMAVRQSLWVTILAVVGMAALIAVLFWPVREGADRNAAEIDSVRQDVSVLEASVSESKSIIPESLKNDIEALRQQVRNVQEKTASLSSFAAEFMDTENGSFAERLSGLEARMQSTAEASDLKALFEKVTSLQKSAVGQDQLSSAVSELNALFSTGGRFLQRDADDESHSANIEAALASAQSEDDALGKTLAGVPRTDLTAAAYLIGLTKFRESLNRGNTPFEQDLALLYKFMGEDDVALRAAVEKLAPKAEQGVLTPDGLSNQFRGLAGEIVVASLSGDNVDLKDKAKARLNNVMQVEKDGELLTGTQTQAKVAKAQALLDQGDVKGAMSILQTLEGDAATKVSPFLKEAEMTVVAHDLKDALAGSLLQKLEAGLPLDGIGSKLGDMDLKKINMGQTLENIKSINPLQGRVIRDEKSGVTILDKGMKLPKAVRDILPSGEPTMAPDPARPAPE